MARAHFPPLRQNLRCLSLTGKKRTQKAWHTPLPRSPAPLPRMDERTVMQQQPLSISFLIHATTQSHFGAHRAMAGSGLGIIVVSVNQWWVPSNGVVCGKNERVSSYVTELFNNALSPNCRYRFIGRIWYKALHKGTLVDVVFADFFLAKWLGKQSVLDHFASTRLEPEPYIPEALPSESLSLSPSLKMARSCAEPSVSALYMLRIWRHAKWLQASLSPR
ncbi:hypothetical protein EDB89DRAFT_1913356 [Lactarius sanguifluus]|nr:hypothetical protein EDB89DRAFT_1913356 [Lactarius sanguifluus]